MNHAFVIITSKLKNTCFCHLKNKIETMHIHNTSMYVPCDKVYIQIQSRKNYEKNKIGNAYALEDKMPVNLCCSAYAPKLFSFFMNFSRLIFNLNFCNKVHIYMDALWTCMISKKSQTD